MLIATDWWNGEIYSTKPTGNRDRDDSYIALKYEMREKKKAKFKPRLFSSGWEGNYGEGSRKKHFENMDTEFEQSFWIWSDFFGVAEHVGISRDMNKKTLKDNCPKSPFIVTAPGIHLTMC